MSTKTLFSPRRGRRAALAALTALVALFCAGTAQAAGEIVRVEEDWRIEMGTPDWTVNAPQITTVMAPSGSLAGVHAVFELNHSTLPSYTAGGLQIQRWNGDNVQHYQNAPTSGIASTADEVVTYTMAVSADGSNLTFEVVNGTSTTWGAFGGQGYLKTSTSSSVTDLSGYDSSASTKFSRIGFASYRVKRFVRTEVRKYATGGVLVSTDPTDVVVHEYSGGF